MVTYVSYDLEKATEMLLDKNNIFKWLTVITLMHVSMCINFAYSETSQNKRNEPVSTTQSIQFTPVWPHGEIREVFKDVFFVTGTNKTRHEGKEIQTSRNMVIVRSGNELTLISIQFMTPLT